MYCSICGSKMIDGARFCQSCGHKAGGSSQPKSIERRENPLKVIKPVLITWVLLAQYLPLQLNLTLMGGAVGGLLGFVILIFTGHTNYVIYPFVYSAIFFFFATPISVYWVRRRTYDETDYRFYQDHLEYAEGFWAVEKKILQYRYITDVSLRKGIIQRLYGLGTIYLSTPSMGPAIRGFRGIRIADVRNPEKIYQKIQEIIATSR